jgi:hypothetical protein
MTITTLSEDADLKRLADRRGVSVTHALRQTIRTELLIQELMDQGAKILILPKDGKELMTNLLLRLARAVLLPVIVEALCEHDQEVTRRLNAELRKPTRPARH